MIIKLMKPTWVTKETSKKKKKLRNHLARGTHRAYENMRSFRYLWIAAKRSSVVRGLLGVITSSLPSSFRKSSEEEMAVSLSGTPAMEKQASKHTISQATWISAFSQAPKSSLSFLTAWHPQGQAVGSVVRYFTKMGEHDSQSSFFSVPVWKS